VTVTVGRVEAALAAAPEDDGIVVCDRDGTILAQRDPAPGGSAAIVVFDVESDPPAWEEMQDSRRSGSAKRARAR
jgi:hypothetical protein